MAAGAHTRIYAVRGAHGGPDVFEVVCEEHELSEVHRTRHEAELAAGDHDDARHGE
jgi:hypothetical protein